MKRFPFVLVLIILIAAVIGLAFYMGWFQVSSNNQNNKPNISLTVDGNKLAADKDKAVEAVQDLGQKAKDKVAGTAPKADETPAVPEQSPHGQD